MSERCEGGGQKLGVKEWSEGNERVKGACKECEAVSERSEGESQGVLRVSEGSQEENEGSEGVGEKKEGGKSNLFAFSYVRDSVPPTPLYMLR